MPYKIAPECIEDAFALYLKYNGERFDLIEREMRLRGWHSFDKQCLSNRGKNDNFREGWIERFGWKSALAINLAAKSKNFLTNAEKVYYEVETIREKLFEQIRSSGVNNRDLIWQHDKYAQRSAELLSSIENAKDISRDFAEFLSLLITIAVKISPTLARELCNAEDAIIKHAKEELKK